MGTKCNQQIWKNEQKPFMQKTSVNNSSSLITRKTYNYHCIGSTPDENIHIDIDYLGLLNFHTNENIEIDVTKYYKKKYIKKKKFH